MSLSSRLLTSASFSGLGVAVGLLGAAGLPGIGGLIVPLIFICLLVLINGLYVAAEFSIIAVRPTQVEQRANAGSRTMAGVLAVLRSPRKQDSYIATAQLGITMASLGLGMYSEPQIAHFIEPYLAQLSGGDVHSAAVTTVGYVIALSLLTYLHIVIGEMIPKTLALAAAMPTVAAVYGPMRLSQMAFDLPVRFLNAVGAALLNVFRIPPVEGQARLYSPEEIAFIVSESAGVGLVNAREEEMVRNIFDFGEREAHQVMTPRNQVQAIPHDAPLADILSLVTESVHSRFPVYEGTLDNIVGILHLKDLVRQQTRTKGKFDIRLLWRPALAVPENYPVSKLLAAFKRQRSHMAIVLDEFGSTAGIVTLEDVIEEIVGEVRDEFDKPEAKIQRLAGGAALVDGLTPIDEVNEYFGLSLADENYDTIAGFVLGRLDRMAKVGDAVEAQGVRLKVEALDRLRIARLLLTPVDKAERKKPDARKNHH